MKKQSNILLLLSLVLIALFGNVILTTNAIASINLTFTSHPTNTTMGRGNFSPEKEIDYYYDLHLKNLAKALLHSKEIKLNDIGNFYSWIGFDFDRSNLSAKSVAYANAKNIQLMLDIYIDYNRDYLNNDTTLTKLLDTIQHQTNRIFSLIKNKDLTFSEFIDRFTQISLNFGLHTMENQFAERLERIDNLNSKKLLSYFNKFRFHAFRGQIRFDGESLNAESTYEDALRIVQIINRIQKYAISDIIISNFSSVTQINEIKRLKKSYDISNINTIPLVETNQDVDYMVRNLQNVVKADNISQIMKAGSDDTKFSGLAASILNLSKLGYAMQQLKDSDMFISQHAKTPILFIGMGSSIERLGGPVFFRSMLAGIIGDNESNRTIQGGELEYFTNITKAEEKLKTEIAIEKNRAKINFTEIESVSAIIKECFLDQYQNIYQNDLRRSDLNQLISNGTNLAYVMDNYQAGSRYKKRIMADSENKLTNNFTDLFQNTRAIDFQTSFVLSGIHPEFIPYKYLSQKQVDKILSLRDNKIMKTYITGIYVLSKQMNPNFYKALDLPVSNTVYKQFNEGFSVFTQIIENYFPELRQEIDSKLKQENYLNYSESASNEMIRILSAETDLINEYKAGVISFKQMTDKLHELNYEIAKLRNLLSLEVKN
jgi:hypothetical protein